MTSRLLMRRTTPPTLPTSLGWPENLKLAISFCSYPLSWCGSRRSLPSLRPLEQLARRSLSEFARL